MLNRVYQKCGLFAAALVGSVALAPACSPEPATPALGKCGDGALNQAKEQCDFGANNGTNYRGDGSFCCDLDCQRAPCGATPPTDGGGADASDGGGIGGDAGDASAACLSASFDGTGKAAMKTPDNAAYDFAGSFTIEAWVKVQGAPALNRALIAGQVVDDMTSSFNSYFLGVNSSLAPIFGVSDGTSTTGTTGTALPLNTWTHIAGVFDGANASLYVGGSLASQNAATQPQAGNGLRIGHALANFAQNFQLNGKIRDIRLSNAARYTANFTPQKRLATDVSTVGLFHLDTIANGMSPDSSATANHAVVTGTVPLVSDCP